MMISGNFFRILLIVSTILSGMGSISAATSNTATSYYDDPDVSTVVGHEFTVTFYAYDNFFEELNLEKADITYDQNAMELLNIKIEKNNNTVPWYKRIFSSTKPDIKIDLQFKALNATGGYKITIPSHFIFSITESMHSTTKKVVNIYHNLSNFQNKKELKKY